MRWCRASADVLLGFPYLVFAIGLMGMMGPGLGNIVITLVLKEWVVPFRVARGETLGAREQDYVEAARALGCPALADHGGRDPAEHSFAGAGRGDRSAWRS